MNEADGAGNPKRAGVFRIAARRFEVGVDHLDGVAASLREQHVIGIGGDEIGEAAREVEDGLGVAVG